MDYSIETEDIEFGTIFIVVKYDIISLTQSPRTNRIIVKLCRCKGAYMYSSVIGKIEKAKRYTKEKERVTFDRFVATFRGENDNHKIEYEDGNLTCSCQFFAMRNFCSHSIALQSILDDMLPSKAVYLP